MQKGINYFFFNCSRSLYTHRAVARSRSQRSVFSVLSLHLTFCGNKLSDHLLPPKSSSLNNPWPRDESHWIMQCMRSQCSIIWAWTDKGLGKVIFFCVTTLHWFRWLRDSALRDQFLSVSRQRNGVVVNDLRWFGWVAACCNMKNANLVLSDKHRQQMSDCWVLRVRSWKPEPNHKIAFLSNWPPTNLGWVKINFVNWFKILLLLVFFAPLSAFTADFPLDTQQMLAVRSSWSEK